MRLAKVGDSGWRGAIRGAILVAITYVYFLIFAQFAFLKRLAELGIADAHLKAVMVAMAAGGILASLLAPRLRVCRPPGLRLGAGFLTCGAVAMLAQLRLDFSAALAVSLLTGLGLGLLTVTLATHLRQFAGQRHPLFAAGLGTGVGYFVCNLPLLFAASAQMQSLTAGVLCLAGFCITLARTAKPLELEEPRPGSSISFPRVLAGFTALVWMDSAAFFIIQNTAELKAGTWEGSPHLWANGSLHFAAALLGVWSLRRKGLPVTLMAAFIALGGACLLLLHPDRTLLASIFYPIGVSFYSVALVAYPSVIAPSASTAERGRIAGWIYAVAGWVGSAMGIGMGQNLHRVPVVFVIAAGAVVLLPLLLAVFRRRVREFAVAGAVLAVALLFDRTPRQANASMRLEAVERGRQVYISEGCIHCHSQYVRPNSHDELMWGPEETLDELHAQHPPLIGNRRQGPDLSQVGARRSALWLKAHFYNPAEVSGASIMPAFDFLFRDERGDDLVAYLESLRGSDAGQHVADEELWQPQAAVLAQASVVDGERLYARDCANCHSADGSTHRKWQANFKRQPIDFANGPYYDPSQSDSPKQGFVRLERIAKFGIPGTDMPGHEYLSDKDVASISLWLSRLIAQSNQKP